MSESRVPEEPTRPKGAGLDPGLEGSIDRERQRAALEELLAQDRARQAALGTPTAGPASREESAPWAAGDPASGSPLGAGELLGAVGAPRWLTGRRTSRVVALLVLPVLLALVLKLGLLYELLH